MANTATQTNNVRPLTKDEFSTEIEKNIAISNSRVIGEKAVYAALSAPFGPDALSTDGSRGFDLTSVKAQYIVERLNEVLGLGGWALSGEYQTTEGGVLFHSSLTIRIQTTTGAYYHTTTGVGFSANKKNVGDTYKGARTDALSKNASQIGVANEVFKGNVSPPSKTAVKAKTTGFTNGKTSGSSFKKNLKPAPVIVATDTSVDADPFA